MPRNPDWVPVPGARRILFGAAFASALALGATRSAFNPTTEDGHVGIVRDALSGITRTLTTGETIKFSNRAIDQVRDATAGVDEIRGLHRAIMAPR